MNTQRISINRADLGPRRLLALVAAVVATLTIAVLCLDVQAGGQGCGGGGGGGSPCGACCFGTGSCLYTSMEECTQLGGDFHGSQSDCNSTICPEPGACCLPDGSCQPLASWACGNADGQFNGVDTLCGVVTCEQPCDGDLDGSGSIDVVDLLDLLSGWGTPGGDITGDGETDVVDLLELLSSWGACG